MIGIVVVSLFSFELIKVMAKSNQYWQAYIIIPVLCLSVFFVNMRDLTTNALFITKRTKKIGFIVLAASVINLLLNIVLIPVLGIIGAALSTLLAQLIYWYITHYFSQREFYIPYENRKLLLLLVVGTIISCSSLLINHYSLAIRMVVKGGLVLSFPFILHLFSFYEPVEIKAIRGFFAKWSNLRKFGDNFRSLQSIKDDI
jgi:O-antigen/teichoic acid export membrane protein